MKHVTFSSLSAADQRLVRAAIAIREKSHAPYSGYKCGAALRDIRNKIHVGCNIETVDYP